MLSESTTEYCGVLALSMLGKTKPPCFSASTSDKSGLLILASTAASMRGSLFRPLLITDFGPFAGLLLLLSSFLSASLIDILLPCALLDSCTGLEECTRSKNSWFALLLLFPGKLLGCNGGRGGIALATGFGKELDD